MMIVGFCTSGIHHSSFLLPHSSSFSSYACQKLGHLAGGVGVTSGTRGFDAGAQ
jgi:hypothetical protein